MSWSKQIFETRIINLWFDNEEAIASFNIIKSKIIPTDLQQRLENIYFKHFMRIMLAMLVTYKKHIVESYTVDNEQNWDINIKAHSFLREKNNKLSQ